MKTAHQQLFDLISQYGLPAQATEDLITHLQPLFAECYLEAYRKGKMDTLREQAENQGEN